MNQQDIKIKGIYIQVRGGNHVGEKVKVIRIQSHMIGYIIYQSKRGNKGRSNVTHSQAMTPDRFMTCFELVK